MKLRTRRLLFYGLAAIFIILGTGTILYAQGWRLDLSTGHVSKVGAIYISSTPKYTNIFLDGKPIQNQSGFLSRGTLISNLFPKTYYLTLTAPQNGTSGIAYDPWEENVSVSPSLVSELKYAVLVPKNATIAASDTISNFLVGDGSLILDTTGDSIWFNDVSSTVGGRTIIDGDPTTGEVLFETRDGDYYFSEGGSLKDAEGLSTAFEENGITDANLEIATLDPYAHAVLIADQKTALLFDPSTQALLGVLDNAPRGTIIGSSIVPSPSIIAGTIFQEASNTTRIFFYDKASETSTVTEKTISGKNQKLGWITDSLLSVLQTDGSLYLYDTNSRNFEKLADDAKDFSVTDDGTMVAALEYKSIEIFSLVDPSDYYRFNPPDVADIQKLIWYKDDSHLFVSYPDHVAFLDLADVSLSNFTTIAVGSSPAYDTTTNALYLIDPSGHLIRFDFPE